MDITPLVAAEGAGGTIADAIADVPVLFSTATTMLSGSPIAMAFVGMSLAGGAIGLLGSLIRVGRRR